MMTSSAAAEPSRVDLKNPQSNPCVPTLTSWLPTDMTSVDPENTPSNPDASGKTSWVVEELRGVDLGDTRLNKRLDKLLTDLGNRPTLSIPAACGGHKEMTGAYRFFDNKKVTLEKVLAPHRQSTIRRAENEEVVLIPSDTTEVDLTRPGEQVKDAGPLATEARYGVHLHLLEAFTPDGTPLGEVWSHVWARDEESLNVPQEEKRKARKKAPIEEKESFRWLNGFRQVRAFAQLCPKTTCVHLIDSEGDVFELYAEPRGETNPIHFVIRLCQDRALVPPTDEDPEAQARLIRGHVEAKPVLFTEETSVRGREAKVSCEDRDRRQPRKNREATVEVRATKVTLRPPWRAGRELPEVTLHVVQVKEVNPPTDDVAVEWLLITTLPIDTIEQVKTIIQYYTVRWMIEIFFRTLKSGCRVEKRRFETMKRVVAALSVYLIVAWRTLFVCRLGRSCPDMDCEAVFDPSEWKSVWMAVKGESPPPKPPRLGDMVRLVAQLGGYVNLPGRKDEPGPQTVWIGLQRMHDLAWAWNLFGPGKPEKSV